MKAPPFLTPANKRMYLFLLVLTIAVFIGFQGWRTLFNNFAVEKAFIGGHEVGIIQGIREVPGFLALLVIYLLFVFKEHTLAALSVLVMGLGVGLTGFFPWFSGLVITTLLMSFGFHYFETLNQSLTLQYFTIHQAPLVFGRLRSMAAITSISVGLGILGLSAWLDYRALYVLLAGLTLAGGLWCLWQDPADKDLPLQKKEMIFRKQYWLFYLLTFFAGARRQIFVAFAVFLLVKKFGFSIQAVTVLFVFNQAVNIFAGPLVGRAINRFGERRVLSLEYLVLIWVFLTYAYAQSAWLVVFMYILDHIVFNCSMAIRTYFQKIAAPGDIAPSMAVGFTINHIAAVVLPVLGGLLWLFDYRFVFLSGVLLSLCSLALVQAIPRKAAEPANSRG
ncbi:MAG: MFS transporter [Desulfohalobiaceae bacterium]|nr:MFS transporter [Desulfohalobiaceae bacterium]